MTTFLTIFSRFPKTFRMISEDSSKVIRRSDDRFLHFPNIFKALLGKADDVMVIFSLLKKEKEVIFMCEITSYFHV